MGSTFGELGYACAINVAVLAGMLVVYTILSKQPLNARVYFTKWQFGESVASVQASHVASASALPALPAAAASLVHALRRARAMRRRGAVERTGISASMTPQCTAIARSPHPSHHGLRSSLNSFPSLPLLAPPRPSLPLPAAPRPSPTLLASPRHPSAIPRTSLPSPAPPRPSLPLPAPPWPSLPLPPLPVPPYPSLPLPAPPCPSLPLPASPRPSMPLPAPPCPSLPLPAPPRPSMPLPAPPCPSRPSLSLPTPPCPSSPLHAPPASPCPSRPSLSFPTPACPSLSLPTLPAHPCPSLPLPAPPCPSLPLPAPPCPSLPLPAPPRPIPSFCGLCWQEAAEKYEKEAAEKYEKVKMKGNVIKHRHPSHSIHHSEAAEKYEKVKMKGNVVKRRQWFNLSLRSYRHAFSWVAVALAMPQRELIAHAGLDNVVFLHTLKLGFKIFGPILIVAAAVLLPVNYLGGGLQQQAQSDPDLTYSDIDMLSIANIPNRSSLAWALYMMRVEHRTVADMRLDYLADQQRAPNQFTVLVRQVPKHPIKTVPEHVDHFFSVNHRGTYLLTQPVYNANRVARLEKKRHKLENKLTELHIKLERFPHKPLTVRMGCMGLVGERVDAIQHYQDRLEEICDEIIAERERVISDPASTMPAAFVSFSSRWGAAVAAQTLQSKNSSQWITHWAPEQRDVKWSNLPIPYEQLAVRRVLVLLAAAAIVFFYTIPVGFVQSLANLDKISRYLPWLQPVLTIPVVNALITDILSGLALKLFMALLPYLLVFLASLEGHVSRSQIDLAATGKYFWFIIGTVFVTNVMGGALMSATYDLSQHTTSIPQILGSRIPTKATFFMTFTMVDGWVGMGGEALQVWYLLLFHLKSSVLVRTPADRIKAMRARPLRLVDSLSQVELYFLLPFVYCVTNPLYLPFALAFYILAFVIYRNQIINVYCPRYEMAGAFWPHFHARLVAAMLVQQVALGGILSLKEAPTQACCLIPLPFVTLIVHWAFIRGQFHSTFSKLALEEANRKDTIDRTVHPNEGPHSFLARAYLHPSLQSAFTMLDGDEEQGGAGGGDSSSSDDDDKDGDEEEGGGKKSKHADRHAQTRLVPVKRHPFSSTAQASPAVPNGSNGLEGVAGTSPPAHLRRSVSDGPGSSAAAAVATVTAVTSAAAAAASSAFAAARNAASGGAAFTAASTGRVAADAADSSTHTPHGIPPASHDQSSEASPYHSCELHSVVIDGPEDLSQNVPLSASSAARPDYPVGDTGVQRGAAASEGMTGGNRGERKPSPQTAGTEPLLAGGGGDQGGKSSGMGKAIGVPVFRL
ncbi:unnamed protein product [Closterium sp. Yama58-4]|nr:unnamed protein product [Closterium sp. Yama58-4]